MHERIISNMISSITSIELERPTITLILTQCLIAILEERHSELQALLFDSKYSGPYAERQTN